MSFPKNFLWRASISVFQAEGAKLEDGKGLTVADLRCQEFMKRLHTADTTVASDFYHHYHEDIKLMKECGLKSFRFSISLARIFPNGNGQINQKGIDFYNDVINELIRNDIVPIVTLFRFDLTQGLIDC
ncbi:MAG: family 1 glycosylhydrolase [Solobacterium sp.]|nr:family 1 glycosylhydrolase [Solobacterium sp.]